MECVDGTSLRGWSRRGRLPPERALAIVPPLCDALQYAQERGIVDRDNKAEDDLLVDSLAEGDWKFLGDLRR
jgi:serine/threonine protein kinase